LQAGADIGILYSRNSSIDGRYFTNHPRWFSALNGRNSMAKSKKGKAKGKAKKSGRKPNPAFMKAMNPSSALAAVVGSSAMPRTEVTKKLWAYIKRNGLQDKNNRRMINADDKLKSVFSGRSQVSMFEMTKLVNNHLK
jgi:chromatin remodeling complex protein RSC6